MPNLTFYIAENQADVLQRAGDFTHKCRALCCDILRAEPQNVHIIFVAVKPGCGQPVYAQLFYRLTTLRTQDVMENFMGELDAAIQQASGLTPRIRCFGSPAEQIFARN